MDTFQDNLVSLGDKICKTFLGKPENENVRVFIALDTPSDLKASFVPVEPKDYKNRTEWRNALHILISTHYMEWRHSLLELASKNNLEVTSCSIFGTPIVASGSLEDVINFSLDAPILRVSNMEEFEKVKGSLCDPDENGNR